MSEVKTLINCNTKEFFKTFNSMRNDLDKFFKATKLNEIIYKTVELPDNLPKEEKEKIAVKRYNERVEKVVSACFGDNIDLTYDILTKMSFGNADYINQMGRVEIVSFVFTMFTNTKLLPFFTSYFPTE